MSEQWNQEQVQPEDINNGNKYTINDQLSLEAVNSIVDNSLYASKTASDAKEIAEEALSYTQNAGTRVLANGAFVAEFDSDTKADKDASNLTDENVKSWREKLYPINSIYFSTNSVSPAESIENGGLGFGTWEQIKDTFLLGAGDIYSNGATGGEATHTLTVNEMPSHTHSISYAKSGGYASGQLCQPSNASQSTATSAGSIYSGVSYSGGSQPHNNMPPYFVVSIWERVE